MVKGDKRSRLVIAIFIPAVLALTLALAYREPRAAGRNLSEWLLQPQSEEREAALDQIGTKALPWLMRWVASSNTPAPWQQRTVLFLRRNTPWQWKFLDRDDPQEKGLLGLYALGTNAAGAAPILVKFVDHSSGPKHAFAITILNQLGPEGVSCLSKALQDSSDDSWVYLAIALRKIGVPDEGATEALLQRIARTKVPKDQAIGLDALGVVGRQSSKSIPFLQAKLTDPSRMVVDTAVYALCSLGTDSQVDVPLLLGCTNATSNARAALVENLKCMEGDKALRHLVALSRDSDRRVCSAAIIEIAAFAPAHPEVAPSLIQALRDPDPTLTFTGTRILKRLLSSRDAASINVANAVTAGLLSVCAELTLENSDGHLGGQIGNLVKIIEEADPEVAVIAGLVPHDKYPWVRITP